MVMFGIGAMLGIIVARGGKLDRGAPELRRVA